MQIEFLERKIEILKDGLRPPPSVLRRGGRRRERGDVTLLEEALRRINLSQKPDPLETTDAEAVRSALVLGYERE